MRRKARAFSGTRTLTMLDRPTCKSGRAAKRAAASAWSVSFWRRHAPRWALLAAVACARGDGAPAPGEQSPAPPVRTPDVPSASRIAIPEGRFASGTEPRSFERNPELEPRLTRTALGRFEIDAEAYPGGGLPPLLGLARDEARERCARRGGRLCTELEWERACKGPASSPFPTGLSLDPACDRAPGCASGFGVWGLASTPEWTASDAPGNPGHAAVVRGAAAGAAASLRRCAHRELATTAPRADIAFRCCYGPPNAARVVLPGRGARFARAELTLAELERLLASDPATHAISNDLEWFEDAAAQDEVRATGGAGRAGQRFTTAPLAWSPAAGVELWVATARSGPSTSFVVVFDALGDGSRRLAASFIMLDETGPVVLAHGGAPRDRIRFSTCWGCPGETGRILYRDPDRVTILQP